MNKGTIAQVIGPVVDVDFNEGEIPRVLNALVIEREGWKTGTGSGPASWGKPCAHYRDGLN